MISQGHLWVSRVEETSWRLQFLLFGIQFPRHLELHEASKPT